METYELYQLQDSFVIKNGDGRRIETKSIKECVQYLLEKHPSNSSCKFIFPPSHMVQTNGVVYRYRTLTDRQEETFCRMWFKATRKK